MSKRIIEQLSNINAISNHEQPVFNYLKEQLNGLAKHVNSDGLGSQVFKISGAKAGKNVAIVAHMDEVGLMLTEISDQGFAKVRTVGSIRPEVLLSAQVTLCNIDNKQFTGVVLARAPHGNVEQSLKIEDLVIDFGFDCRADYSENNIHIGDPISLNNDFNPFGKDMLVGKAFDDRLGCAILIEIGQKVANELEYGNLFLCASVQEEVGLRGAQTIIQSIDEQIDYVLVIDVSPIDDAFGPVANKIGAGALLRVADPRMLFDYQELHKIRQIAADNKISYQEYFSKGGTDAAMIQVQDSGYKVAAICIGGRNLHTNNSIISYNDYVACRDLSYHYVIDLLRG